MQFKKRYTATKVGAERNLELFSKQVFDVLDPAYSNATFPNIESVLDIITSKASSKEEKLILVIDELPYWAEKDDALLSVLQKYIDTGSFITEVGTWWGVEQMIDANGERFQQSADIDVVGISTIDKTAILGECKFKNEKIDKEIFDTLIRRSIQVEYIKSSIKHTGLFCFNCHLLDNVE